HPLAGAQHRVEQGHMGRQVAHRDLADRADAGDHRVVVHHQRAVRALAHIELDAVGPQAARLGERLDRVLDEAVGASAMREDSRPRTAPSPRAATDALLRPPPGRPRRPGTAVPTEPNVAPTVMISPDKTLVRALS